MLNLSLPSPKPHLQVWWEQLSSHSWKDVLWMKINTTPTESSERKLFSKSTAFWARNKSAPWSAKAANCSWRSRDWLRQPSTDTPRMISPNHINMRKLKSSSTMLLVCSGRRFQPTARHTTPSRQLLKFCLKFRSKFQMLILRAFLLLTGFLLNEARSLHPRRIQNGCHS